MNNYDVSSLEKFLYLTGIGKFLRRFIWSIWMALLTFVIPVFGLVMTIVIALTWPPTIWGAILVTAVGLAVFWAWVQAVVFALDL